MTSKTLPFTATHIGFEGSEPLCRDSSSVVMGSFRGGLGVGISELAGADIEAVDLFESAEMV